MESDENRALGDDWDAYESARIRNDQIHGEYLRTFSERSYEYGVLSVKNMTFISGGALVAIPALAGLSPKITPEIAASAGVWFAAALVVCIATTYLIHLNWSANYNQRDAEYERDHVRAVRRFLPSRIHEYGDDQHYYSLAMRHYKFAWWTFFVPHVLGVASYGAFLLGCWRLYGGILEAVN